MYTTCSELVVFMYWTGDSMDNLSSYLGLVDTRIRASNKDLPVPIVVQLCDPLICRLGAYVAKMNNNFYS